MATRRRKTTAFSLFAFQDIITSVTGVMILVTMILALELINRKVGSPANQTEAVSESVVEAVESVKQLEDMLAKNQERIQQLKMQQGKIEDGLRDHVTTDVDQIKSQLADLQEVQRNIADDLSDAEKTNEHVSKQNEAFQNKAEQVANDVKSLDEEIAETTKQLQELRDSKRVVYNLASNDEKAAWLVQISGDSLLAAKAGVKQPPTRFGTPEEFLKWTKTRDPNKECFVLLVKPSGILVFHNILDPLTKQRFDRGYDLITEDQEAIDAKEGAGV